MARLDIARARTEVGYFLHVVGVALTDWQLRPLALDTRFTAVVAGRQMGKSLTLAGLALWAAFRKPRQHVLIVSATEDGARRLLGTVRGLATASPVLANSVEDELAGLLTLSNGSLIRSVPASERQVRGWTVDLLLIDEAQLVPDDLILGAAIPTTAARADARVVLAGSASVASGSFFDFVRAGEIGDEHVRSHRWIAKAAGGGEDAPWITASSIAAAKGAMSEQRFAAEYLAAFAGTGDLWINRSQLERVLVDRPILSLASLTGPARISLGIDWGARVDRSVAVGLGRIPGESRFVVVCAHREPAGTPGTQFIKRICDSPGHYGYVIAERNGLGEGYCEMLKLALRRREVERGGGAQQREVVLNVHTFERLMEERKRPRSVWEQNEKPKRFVTKVGLHNVSAQSKTSTYSSLRIMLDREELLIPRSAEELIRELLLLQIQLTATGHERIEASSGHDDLADALGHALVPRNVNGRWLTLINHLAQRPAPEPEIDATDDPTAFQSIAGPQVTTFKRSIRPAPMRVGKYTLNI